MSTSETCSDVAQQHLRLCMAEGVGPILFDRLVQAFGGAEAVLAAPASRLQEVEEVGRKTAEGIAVAARSDAWQAEVELAGRLGVRILCRQDGEYPEPLRQIPDPPICLYVMGQLRREDALSIAIVGSRQASMYGLEQAQRFAELLSQTGLSIVSGMARGIDQAAHMAALRMGGRTIAVLGCGLSLCYPPESVELRDRIIKCGAVISELPLATAPSTQTFPKRNRIIAGLSLGTLVVEAAKRSGALITARVASEYNREVFALPGRIDTPTAGGTNESDQPGLCQARYEHRRHPGRTGGYRRVAGAVCREQAAGGCARGNGESCPGCGCRRRRGRSRAAAAAHAGGGVQGPDDLADAHGAGGRGIGHERSPGQRGPDATAG